MKVATTVGDPWLEPRAVSLQVDAAPADVYRLVSDVERIGEWSPECRSAIWRDDQRGAGARFRGRNRSGANRWSRICEVLLDEPDREFSWRTIPGGPTTDDSTRWSFVLEPSAAGTLLTQRMQVIKKPQAWFRPYIRLTMPQHLDMRAQMRTTLEAIRATAESQASARASTRPASDPGTA
jgi:uncharacterized protein YndB with AHSA1/START domain